MAAAEKPEDIEEESAPTPPKPWENYKPEHRLTFAVPAGPLYGSGDAPDVVFDAVAAGAKSSDPLGMMTRRKSTSAGAILKLMHSDIDKVSYSDYSDYPENLPKPLLDSFSLLQNPKYVGEQKLRLHIPHTIVWEGGDEPPVWLYTNNDGIVSKRTFHEKKIYAMLKSLATCECVAVLKKVGPLPHQNELQAMSTRDLEMFLGRPQRSKCILQQFVQASGGSAYIVRARWVREGRGNFTAITSRYPFHVPSEDLRQRFCVCTDQPETCSVITMSPTATAPLQSECDKIARYIEAVRRGVRFGEMVIDFIKDLQGRWVFLQFKAYKNAPLPPPSTRRRLLATPTLNDEASSSPRSQASKHTTQGIRTVREMRLRDDSYMVTARGLNSSGPAATAAARPSTAGRFSLISGTQLLQRTQSRLSSFSEAPAGTPASAVLAPTPFPAFNLGAQMRGRSYSSNSYQSADGELPEPTFISSRYKNKPPMSPLQTTSLQAASARPSTAR